jgi:hypothetical protein
LNISDLALKAVAFIGTKKDGCFLPRATAFFVNYTECQHPFHHLVTAEHVISGLFMGNYDIWLRVNLVNGKTAEIPLNAQHFRVHPDNAREAADVAVCPINPAVTDEQTGELIEMDAVSLLLNGQEDGFIPTDEFARQYMGRGGVITIVGLFRSHFGENRNIPIVRVGNISMLPGEPVRSRHGVHVKAYLVEARSIAGLSGSPVFAHPDPALEIAKALAKKKPVGQHSALLGLVHGHFDVPNLNDEDVVTDDGAPARGIHTGIGVVIPVGKIIETLNHPELVAMRKARCIELNRDTKS